MRSFFLFLLSMACASGIRAQQVPKTVIAEHFTNTYCSVCASRNPGFYNNLSHYPQVLHIAYHPSSPYATCPLSMHNVAENNERTNHYGIFGATPRLVIQGVVISSSAAYADPALFTSVLGATTSFSMRVSVAPAGTGSVTTTIIVKKEDTSSLTSLQLYGALVEDTLFFTAANGEPRSCDVFRKALWAPGSHTIAAPAAVGDSAVFTVTTAMHAAWAPARMYAIAMLQQPSNAMVQAARSANLQPMAGMNGPVMATGISLYPNPATNMLYINGISSYPCHVGICDVNGRIIKTATIQNSASFIDVSSFVRGIYFLKGLEAGAGFAAPFMKAE